MKALFHREGLLAASQLASAAVAARDVTRARAFAAKQVAAPCCPMPQRPATDAAIVCM